MSDFPESAPPRRLEGGLPTLEGARIRLRPITVADCNETYLGWMRDHEVVRYTESRFDTPTLETLRIFVSGTISDRRNLFFAIITKADGKHVGNIKLGPLNWHHGLGDVGIIIGDKASWGHGYATESIELLSEYALNELGLHKLTASCYQQNLSSVRAFLKAGFFEEGGRREHYFCDGEFVDTIQLGRLSKRAVAPHRPIVAPETVAEFERLERLFRGEFEDSYVARHKDTPNERKPFWDDFLSRHSCERVLEIGCGTGFNLRWIAQTVPPRDVFGIDINESALTELRVRVPGANAVWGRAWDLPFRAHRFDLVFTAGVLMHQPQDTLVPVLAEMVRCSRRDVMFIEYFGEREEEIPYRGLERVLFKRDYEKEFAKHFAAHKLIEKGRLDRASGWDDVTWWLFRAP